MRTTTWSMPRPGRNSAPEGGPDRRRFLLKGLLAGMVVVALAAGGPTVGPSAWAQEDSGGALAAAGRHWVGTWAASPAPSVASDPVFRNQTVRQIMRISIGGDRVRVRLSNEHGRRALTVGAAHLAIAGAGASILPGTDRVLTFSGRRSVTIQPGAPVLSDPVSLKVGHLARLAVSLHLPGAAGRVTLHRYGERTAYISPPGDFTGVTRLPVARTSLSRFVLSGVDVLVPRRTGAVVTFGDSIPDGSGSTPDTDRRWPDRLAKRLTAGAGRPVLGVINAGYFGNRLLHNGIIDPAFGHFGLSGLARFDRDVLAQPGVRFVIAQIGINDIGQPGFYNRPREAVTAAQIIFGLRQLIARARTNGLTIFGGTLTPFVGAPYAGYGTPEGEAKRQAVNRWIRTSGAFDAVIDFDAVVRNPSRPRRLLPAYDSGDHLHLNDAGYRAMANAVDLALLR